MPNHLPKGVEWMRHIASLGGQASGKRRYDKVPAIQRRLIATNAARARWGKPKWTEAEETAYREIWEAQIDSGLGWPRPKRPGRVKRRSIMPSGGAPVQSEDRFPDLADSTPPTGPAELVRTGPDDGRSDQFIERIARHPEFQSMLAQFQDQPKIQNFMRALARPKYKRWSVTRIAEHSGLSAMDLLSLWRQANVSKTVMTLVEGGPKVAEDTVADAMSTLVCCPRCDGFGDIKRAAELEDKGEAVSEGLTKTCPNCDGTGSVRKPGDPESRKVVFKAIGVLDSKAAVNVDNTVYNFPGLASVLDEIEASRKERTIDRRERTIDTEAEHLT